MSDALQYHYLTGATTSVMRPGRYTFSPIRGYKWLQRLCFFVLEKLGCHAWDEETTYTQVSIKRDSVKVLIHEQWQALRYMNGPDAVRGVILGPEEARQLTGEVLQECCYSMPIPPTYHSPYQRGEYRGLKLFVLPWAKGVTLLPDL